MSFGPKPSTPTSKPSTPTSQSSTSTSSKPTSTPTSKPTSTSNESFAKKVYNHIKKLNEQKVQYFKDTINSIDTEFYSITKKKKTVPPVFFLFVVSNNNILGLFETENEFKLESSNKYNNTELLPKNYITSSRNHFNSVTNIKEINKLTVENIADATADYIDIDSYKPLINNNSKIYFYVYNVTSELIKTYFTYGNIYIYGEGIASTCEISEINEINKSEDSKLDVLPNITPITVFDKKTQNYTDLINEIKTKIFGNDETTGLLNINCVYIHYLNAISPDNLKDVLKNQDKLKAVIKILYVNISCPYKESNKLLESNKSPGPDDYNLLHKYINYYYEYKTQSRSKINEYISQKEYSQFVMHIFDFFEFLMFLTDKESQYSSKVFDCCFNIYNL